MFERIVKDYPDSDWTFMTRGNCARSMGSASRSTSSSPTPISGAEITMKGLKGKVVVIGFWATDCPTKVPTKKLYAEYKDKGVEFIGVSLDEKEGGLEKLEGIRREGRDLVAAVLPG